MRHRQFGKKLNRDTDHRRALIKNLIRSLVICESVVTTKTKAGVLRRNYEKLMTKAKKGTLLAQRQLQVVLQDRKLVQKMINKGKGDFKDRTSGFVRLVPQSARRGDGAMMTRVELVVKQEVVSKPVSRLKLAEKKVKSKVAKKDLPKEVKTKEAK